MDFGGVYSAYALIISFNDKTPTPANIEYFPNLKMQYIAKMHSKRGGACSCGRGTARRESLPSPLKAAALRLFLELQKDNILVVLVVSK